MGPQINSDLDQVLSFTGLGEKHKEQVQQIMSVFRIEQILESVDNWFLHLREKELSRKRKRVKIV